MIIVFIGSPFSGKGTQAELLGRQLGLPVFSMGGLIRKAYKAKDSKAIEGFEKYSMKGLHVPIELKFPFLEEKLNLAKGGFILDNFPATSEDLKTFVNYLAKHSLSVNRVFHIYISDEEMLKRMYRREGRPDDTREITIKRRKVQDKDRTSVLAHFKHKGILEDIDGRKSIKEIHREIRSRLGLNAI